MKAIMIFLAFYVILDIDRKLRDKNKYLTKKEFTDYKASQDANNAAVGKRLDSLESSAFA